MTFLNHFTIAFLPEGQVQAHVANSNAKMEPASTDGAPALVTKVLGITRPHMAVFDERDSQQLAIAGQVVSDLKSVVDIVGAPTAVRPTDLP